MNGHYLVKYNLKAVEKKHFGVLKELTERFLTLSEALAFARVLRHNIRVVGKPELQEKHAGLITADPKVSGLSRINNR